MNKLVFRGKNVVDYEMKDPRGFSNHIFNALGRDSSMHEEDGNYFSLMMI